MDFPLVFTVSSLENAPALFVQLSYADVLVAQADDADS
ncbi:hypothetical protein SynPROS91_01080 [Synechococcus sp. PROS-9-1]|nr:hypothetical protein SynPROS91_01080 [Synechococcus sp. PROS-9-1]